MSLMEKWSIETHVATCLVLDRPEIKQMKLHCSVFVEDWPTNIGDLLL